MKWVIWVMKRVVRIILRSPVFPVGDGVVVGDFHSIGQFLDGFVE